MFKLCKDATAGYDGYVDTAGCLAMAMFWISHIQNYINDNVAVGSRICYWWINHNMQSNFNPPLSPFKNNRASYGLNNYLQNLKEIKKIT